MTPRAHATVVVLALGGLVAGCSRDFDGLFTKSADNASGGGGTSGGTSGNAGGDTCACPACSGTSCSFVCPKGCASCTCAGFVCPPDDACKVDCAAGAACDVTCGVGATCSLVCELDAQCTCSGDGCDVSCPDGKQQKCAKGGVVCNRDCP